MHPTSSKLNEVVSPAHQAATLTNLLRAVPDALSETGTTGIVQAQYGYGSGLHSDLTYVPMKVGTDWLARFIDRSLDQKIVIPCGSDFILIVEQGALELEFCHHGHVHVSGSDPGLINRFLASSAMRPVTFTPVRSASEA